MFTILGADGKEYGPVTAGKIHDWIANGRANLQTKALRYGDTAWKTLGDFPEFSNFGTSSGNMPIPPPVAPAPVAEVVPELVPASRWLRLGAVMLDSLIGCLLGLPGFVLLMAAGLFTRPDQPNPTLLLAGYVVLGVAMLVILTIQLYLLTTRGQTLGKKLLQIKIVRFDDGTNPGFTKVFLLRVLVNGLIGSIPFVGAVYTLVDICFIFREDRRCLHDLIAGTKVVNA